MAKKKRQNQSSDLPIVLDLSPISTNKELENNSKSICPHVNKALDTNCVKKAVAHEGGFFSLSCSKCQKIVTEDSDISNLCLCLQCGSCNCYNHVKHHISSPHSDPHDLSLQLKNNWTVWCYKCNEEVCPDSNGKLRNSLSILRQVYNNNLAHPPRPKTKTENRFELVTELAKTMDNECTLKDLETSSSPTSSIYSRQSMISPKVKGLMNLGNTCFFNSVLQCLAQTPFLLEILQEMEEPGERVCLNIDEENHLMAELDKWGPLTEVLAETLEQMTNGSNSVLSPGALLDALRRKCRQFIGYNQHDSHELLRQMLDSVKTEDIRRYQVHILQHFGLSKKSSPDEMDEKKRALAKSLNQKLTEIVVIRPDHVFRGTLVSTVQCTRCLHTSEVVESFLDLSLPVSFDKPHQPPMITKRKPDLYGDSEQTKSKHKKKKEKKAARKENRLKNRMQKAQNGPISSDNADEDSANNKPCVPPSIIVNGEQQCSLPKIQKDKEILSSALGEIYGSSSSTNNTKNIDQKMKNSESSYMFMDDSPIKDDTDVLKKADNNSLSGTLFLKGKSGDVTIIEDMENTNDVEMGNQFRNSPTSSCIKNNLSGNNSSCDSNDGDLSEDEDGDDDADDGDETDDENDDESNVDGANINDIDRYYSKSTRATLQKPYECSDGESSIQSCLNQFTALEILTGNNKVCCESCTERQNKGLPNNVKKKPIYHPATKQFLISSPPAVLILHLKRFQAMFCSFKKVSKFVSYPLELDIGPFCSIKCQNIQPNQTTILYSLYGVVEHSGSLYGGHYVAYVKVRKPVEKNSYRRSFLLSNSPISVPKTYDAETIEQERVNTSGSWYYISDSSVRSVSEEEVLKAQAYLLFYERIC